MITKMIAFDWLTMKKGLAVDFIIIPILILVSGAFHPLYMIPLSVFFSFGFTPFGAEEKGDLHYLHLSMPVKRSDVVVGRFALSFIIFLCSLILGRLLISVMGFISANIGLSFLIHPSISFSEYLTILTISYLLYALLSLLVFPVMFKLGYSKGKHISIYGGYIPLMFIFVVLAAWDWSTTVWGRRAESPIIRLIEYASENLVASGIALFIVSTSILLLSYLLSLRAYRNRDF
ncbi:MAG: ABC-2 transporter permease [Defluviitaleaceae bacterium]|nr:ABC-2 transporter permease [Defluviitaleaceae bacterium]